MQMTLSKIQSSFKIEAPQRCIKGHNALSMIYKLSLHFNESLTSEDGQIKGIFFPLNTSTLIHSINQ
ncbi:hypothetical protein AAY473_039346, partial [Plecturocebus cupreus]